MTEVKRGSPHELLGSAAEGPCSLWTAEFGKLAMLTVADLSERAELLTFELVPPHGSRIV